jgi:hypothetical protein
MHDSYNVCYITLWPGNFMPRHAAKGHLERLPGKLSMMIKIRVLQRLEYYVRRVEQGGKLEKERYEYMYLL